MVGCAAHARRKFDEALTALPKEQQQTFRAAEALCYFAKLFQLEQSFAELKPEERYTKRLEQAKPVLDALLAWANDLIPRTAPKSALGKALHYLKEQWPYLVRYLEDGRLEQPVEDGDDRATTQSGLDQVAAFGRKSVPSIDLRQSIRNFSGVRAVTSEEDFIIRPAKNSPRMLYVCGIKSPGLSAAPAIADYALEKLKEMGLAAEKKTMWSGKRTQIRFRKLSDSEKAELVRKDPRYGRIICRCETITEGEIIAAIHSPIPPCSIDGVKRRTGAGMGRCQGGFCGPRVLKILADELGKDPMEIVQDGSATWLLMEETKGGSGK